MTFYHKVFAMTTAPTLLPRCWLFQGGIAGVQGEHWPVELIAQAVVPCTGMKAGMVVDIGATTDAIRQCIAEVEQQTQQKVETVWVNVSGTCVP